MDTQCIIIPCTSLLFSAGNPAPIAPIRPRLGRYVQLLHQRQRVRQIMTDPNRNLKIFPNHQQKTIYRHTPNVTLDWVFKQAPKGL